MKGCRAHSSGIRLQVGVGALGVCQVQPTPSRQCHVWEPPLALELHSGPPHHHSHHAAPGHVGSLLITRQVLAYGTSICTDLYSLVSLHVGRLPCTGDARRVCKESLQEESTAVEDSDCHFPAWPAIFGEPCNCFWGQGGPCTPAVLVLHLRAWHVGLI